MLYVLKTDPIDIEPGGRATVTVQAFFGGAEIAPGDECFLWLSESAGGKGLTAECTVEAVSRSGRERQVTFKALRLVHSELGTTHLRKYREGAERPEGLIARKLYRHAHNKVAAITQPEADWLRMHF